jgi:uncharacterized phage-associated protein
MQAVNKEDDLHTGHQEVSRVVKTTHAMSCSRLLTLTSAVQPWVHAVSAGSQGLQAHSNINQLQQSINHTML